MEGRVQDHFCRYQVLLSSHPVTLLIIDGVRFCSVLRAYGTVNPLPPKLMQGVGSEENNNYIKLTAVPTSDPVSGVTFLNMKRLNTTADLILLLENIEIPRPEYLDGRVGRQCVFLENHFIKIL